MQLLLGVFFFSVLLTTGSALSCEVCTSQNSDCTGSKQDCTIDNAVCMTLVAEINLGSQKSINTIKGCSTKNACQDLKDMKGKATAQQTLTIPIGSVIKDVTCSKAPPSFASFFPAFLGLLLMKLLF